MKVGLWVPDVGGVIVGGSKVNPGAALAASMTWPDLSRGVGYIGGNVREATRFLHCLILDFGKDREVVVQATPVA
jgi:hypothetical protein